eukprot:978466-Pyramimonas_sp.AAC.1
MKPSPFATARFAPQRTAEGCFRLVVPLPTRGREIWVTQEGVQLKGGGALDLGQLYCKCLEPEDCIALYCNECIARKSPAIHLRPGMYCTPQMYCNPANRLHEIYGTSPLSLDPLLRQTEK